MVEKYTTSHVITKNLLMAMSTDLFNGTLFFSCSFITQNVYTDRVRERRRRRRRTPMFAPWMTSAVAVLWAAVVA